MGRLRHFFKYIYSRLAITGQIPAQYQNNFTHLYLDYFWVGVLNGSILAFLTIYAARIGATGWQIGLIAAIPGAVNLIFALPSGSYLERRPIIKTVFWSSVIMRIFYMTLVAIPIFLIPTLQIWVIVVITLIMNIPGTILVIGFNTMLADLVPIQYRAQVAGTRNALFSITTIVTTLICGSILKVAPFPLSYQVVFGIGLAGAALSSINLKKIKPLVKPVGMTHLTEWEKPDSRKDGRLPAVNLNFLRLDILSGEYGKLMLKLFNFHLFQYLAIPLFPIFLVQHLKYSEWVISVGNAAFYLSFFLASTRMAYLAPLLGNKKIVGIGVVLMSAYCFFLAFSFTPLVYYLGSLIGGIGWSMAGGAVYNYIFEKTPNQDLPAHIAWYNLALNSAILVGSLVGPVIGGFTGITTALVIFGIGRVAAGLLILR
jgi:MFS family permease